MAAGQEHVNSSTRLVLVQFDCPSVYRVSKLIALLDPDGCGCTGVWFPVFGSGFRFFATGNR